MRCDGHKSQMKNEQQLLMFRFPVQRSLSDNFNHLQASIHPSQGRWGWFDGTGTAWKWSPIQSVYYFLWQCLVWSGVRPRGICSNGTSIVVAEETLNNFPKWSDSIRRWPWKEIRLFFSSHTITITTHRVAARLRSLGESPLSFRTEIAVEIFVWNSLVSSQADLFKAPPQWQASSFKWIAPKICSGRRGGGGGQAWPPPSPK